MDTVAILMEAGVADTGSPDRCRLTRPGEVGEVRTKQQHQWAAHD